MLQFIVICNEDTDNVIAIAFLAPFTESNCNLLFSFVAAIPQMEALLLVLHHLMFTFL